MPLFGQDYFPAIEPGKAIGYGLKFEEIEQDVIDKINELIKHENHNLAG